MKKIGIMAFSDINPGGTFQYSQSMIYALKNETKNKFIIFCDMIDNRFDNYGLEIRKFNLHKSSMIIKFFKYFILIFKWNNSSFIINHQEKKIFNDIDLFLSPFIVPYPAFFMNKPFIFTLHDMQERYYPEFFTLKGRITRRITNNAMAIKARKIICESEYVKSDIIKFTGANKDKIVVIQSPPPQEFLSFNFDETNNKIIRKKYNLPQKYLFYPAQSWFHKNHIRLLEAFNIIKNKIDDLHLILTGSKQNNYFNIMEQINKLNLNDKVKHLGYIDYKDLPYIYKMSKMLVMPTLFESVSIPIYEAFSLKVPVCCSNVTALPEQIGDAGLIFDPFDIKDMSDKIMMYLNNESLIIEKVQKGFERMLNFNHEEYKKKLLEIIE